MIELLDVLTYANNEGLSLMFEKDGEEKYTFNMKTEEIYSVVTKDGMIKVKIRDKKCFE